MNSCALESNGGDEQTALVNLAEFIAGAKTLPALAGIIWEAKEWRLQPSDPVVKKARAHKSFGDGLIFTTRESSSRGSMRAPVSQRSAIPSPYIDFVKADVRTYSEAANVSLSVLRRLLTAHQFLERELRRDGCGSAVNCLTLRHFHQAQKSMVAEQAAATAYRISQGLVHISKVIDQRRLTTHSIGYQTTLKRPFDGDELTDEGQAEGLKKMISQEALDKLADIFASPKDDYERLVISIVGLFVAGGFRAGEVLTLPVDCWHSEPGGSSRVDPDTGTMVCNEGILYAAEKVQDYRVKWLPRDAVDMAKRAVDDLTRLCRPAREMARWMENNPGRLKPFADLASTDWISGKEACSRLGFAEQVHHNWKIFKENRITSKGKSAWFRVGDIERSFLECASSSVAYTMPNGRSQKLSETLVVMWQNQFRGSRSALFMPKLMTHSILSRRISTTPSHDNYLRSGGLLTKFGLRVTTKQFRHWLNTMADRGGISDIDLAKWMGRRDITQNKVYKHGLLAVRTEEARRLILAGEATGTIPRIAFSLPLAERESFVRAAVEAAHVMSYGMCIHNFAASPCSNCNKCLRKCPEYIRIKGDMEQRQALLELKAIEEANRRRALEAAADGFYGAEKWALMAEETLDGIDDALAVDDDPLQVDGARVAALRDSNSAVPTE